MNSHENKINVSTLEAAQNGCKESLSVVIEQTKSKLYTFLYRLTLDYHLSEDLCQETILALMKSIQRLHFDSEAALWAWLFRTAQGKVQHHRRAQGKKHLQQKTLIDMNRISKTITNSDMEPTTGLFRQDVMDTIFRAMDALKLEYRSVIVMRCMNELSYAQIAAILGGTQLRNKMLFYRARRALKQELAHKGMERSHFFGALVAFASVTSLSSKGAAGASLISSASLKVGIPCAILSTAISKVGMVAASIVLLFGLVTGFTPIRAQNPTQPTLSDPYANLHPSFQEDEFAYPSSVIATRDPDRNGFWGIDASVPRPKPSSITCAEVLVGEPSQKERRLILSGGHWIEVGFDGPLIDGPGPDLFYTGWYCPITRVFLTDGVNAVYELERPTCTGNCSRFHIVPFDISGLDLPFDPKAIRIQGVGHWNRFKGFELMSLRARTQNTQSPAEY
ncbi:RNA polymerase sigma factor [Planctomycetota bacterium]